MRGRGEVKGDKMRNGDGKGSREREGGTVRETREGGKGEVKVERRERR